MGRKRKANKNNSLPRQSFNEMLQEEENATDLSELLNKKWKVFRVSHIYNFNRANLKGYSKKLSEELNSGKKFASNILFKSKFSLNKNLRKDAESPESLQIQVLAEESQIYLGHLISWSKRKANEDGISLPILLVQTRGPDLHRIHTFLCKLFDCDIQPVTFSFNALGSFLVKLLETPKPGIEMAQAVLTLEYKIPGCTDKDSIKLFLSLEDVVVVVIVILENLYQKDEGIPDLEVVWEVYSRLLNHVYNVYKMDLMYAELQKITFPDAFMAADGQLKMSSLQAASSCLDVLQCFTPLDATIAV